MSFNEYENTTDKNIIEINYRTAQGYEKSKKYKEAIKLYTKNIFKYDDNASKVRLAKLYISGKLGKNNNVEARKLLEDAYEQDYKKGQALYAYMLANGIGGKKDKKKAFFIFKDEMNLSNPDPMIYIELSKYLNKEKNKKHVAKSLKQAVTPYEINKYKRKVSIDKFNNFLLGRIVNYIPNKLSVYFDDIISDKEDEKLSYNLGDLFDKAKLLNDSGKEKNARIIYKRLVEYGDNDSKIIYANMCYKGIGGKKDIKSAKEIYEEFIIKKNKNLSKNKNELEEMYDLLESAKKESLENKLLKGKNQNRKYIRDIIDEIEFLENRKSKILLSKNYKEAELNYGLLLVDNYTSQEELDRGIAFLKYVATTGESVTPKGCITNKNIKLNDKRARIAIVKLGKLYENGIWNPTDIDEARKMFCKFSTGKISRYTSYISDQMKNGEEVVYKSNVQNNEVSNVKKSKKCNIRYNFGSLCELLRIKKLARITYESMHKRGDYRGDYSLARYEHLGKGGVKDYVKAKEHYRYFINSIYNSKNRSNIKIRTYAMKDLADLLLEENDIIEAVQIYKNSAIMGNKKSKIALRNLFKEGKWVSVTRSEKELIKLRGINKIITNISEKYSNKRNKHNSKISKQIAASIAIATAVHGINYNNTRPMYRECFTESQIKENYNVKNNELFDVINSNPKIAKLEDPKLHIDIKKDDEFDEYIEK